MTAEARRQVQELSRQRDAISSQLQSLRDTVAAAVGPSTGGAPSSGRADGGRATQDRSGRYDAFGT